MSLVSSMAACCESIDTSCGRGAEPALRNVSSKDLKIMSLFVLRQLGTSTDRPRWRSVHYSRLAATSEPEAMGDCLHRVRLAADQSRPKKAGFRHSPAVRTRINRLPIPNFAQRRA